MAAKRCIIGRRLWLFAALGALLAIALAFLFFHPASFPGSGERLLRAAQGLNRYDLSLRLDAEKGALSISENVTFRNTTGETLHEIVLRTWLNAYGDLENSPVLLDELYDLCCPEGFSTGGLTLYDVKWRGIKAEWNYLDDEKTVLRLSIPALAPGEEGEIFLRCVAELPRVAHRAGVMDGFYQMGNVIPLLSRYEDGAWRQDPYSPVGDPFVSDSADFSVTLALPDGFAPACTAYLEKGRDGLWRGEALAVRDFALCAGQGLCQKQARQGNTLILSLAEDAGAAGRALTYARQAIETYSRLYGEYPWPVYTVCSARFPLGGMEYPCLSVIDRAYYQEKNRDSLELMIAHETAHQWFYNLVGSDQVRDPWQDEALCEYAMLRYVRERYGRGSFETLKSARVDAPMRETLWENVTPGSPIDYFASYAAYTAAVYGRGAALLLALEEMNGDVDGFLRQYADAFAFSYARRADFEGLLSRFTGMDVAPLLTDYLDTLM